MNKNPAEYMARAIELAELGRGKTSPNPLVGCVIVKNGKIIAEGWHKKYGGDHAEIAALKKCGARADGATMYVTLEPCFHFGHTPPCVDDVIAYGIEEVYIAIKDPNPATNGRSIAKLKKAGVKVHTGLLKELAEAQNEVFLHYITRRRPFTVVKTAQTLDGKIATRTGSSQWITSEATRVFTHRQRDQFDAILVGINTVLKDDPLLNGVKKPLIKIVLDTALRIPLDARLFKDTPVSNVIVVTASTANTAKMQKLRRKATILIAPRKGGRIDLSWVVAELAKHRISSLLIEGGAEVVGSALKAGLVDKMWILIAPKIIGDQNARSAVTGIDGLHIDQAVKLQVVTAQSVGEDLFLEAYVHGNR